VTWFASLGGKRVLSGRVTIPLYGPWSGDLVLAEGVTVSGATSLVIGDLTMACFARPSRSGTFAGKASSRVVGGAGGWNTVIPPKGYSLATGIKLSVILQDAASAAGERIEVATDRNIGVAWTRKQGRASRVLRLLLDGQWWVAPSGVAQTAARSSTRIASPFQLIDYKPHLGLIEISTERYSDWTPGRTFSAPTLPAVQTISSVSFVIADGKVRTQVTNSATREDRLIQEIRSIIRDEVSRLEYGTIVEYEITSAEEMAIACKPTAGSASPWPPLAKVPLKAGLLGEVNTPTVGKKCLIVFMDNDPSLYRCIGVEGPNQKTTFETSGNVEVTAGGIFKVNGGGNFVALANLVNDNFASLVASFDSHTHGTGVGPTTPPIVPVIELPPVDCVKLKTD